MIPLVEIPMPQRDEVAFAAFAPLPKAFGEKDRQRLAVAVRVLSDGTQEYSRRTIFDVTEGRTVQTSLLPDGVLVRFVVPKANLTNGVALMEGLLRRPTLLPESLDAALRRLQRAEPDGWSSALRPSRNSLRSLTPDEARGVLRRVFDPRRTAVAAVGGFAAGGARKGWETRTADWRPLPEPRYPDNTPSPEPTESGTSLTTVELRSSPLVPGDPAMASRWLALAALGVGKGASLFRDVRQAEGWSYRQEAILWPDRQGLVARLLAVAAPDSDEGGRAEALRTTLIKAVEGWTESDRQRALKVVDLDLGPLWLGDAPLTSSLLDRATLEAYWLAKAGVPWDAERLHGAMEAVSLDALKAAATDLLKGSRATVLPGRPRT